MDGKIRFLVYKVVGKPIEVYGNDFEDFQKIVEGNFEYVDLGFLTGYTQLRGYDLFCNEDGIGLNLPLNRVFKNSNVLGNFIISKANEEGKQISLTDEDVNFILNSLEIINGKR